MEAHYEGEKPFFTVDTFPKWKMPQIRFMLANGTWILVRGIKRKCPCLEVLVSFTKKIKVFILDFCHVCFFLFIRNIYALAKNKEDTT